jgi:filamentous hemagglutinin family protein
MNKPLNLIPFIFSLLINNNFNTSLSAQVIPDLTVNTQSVFDGTTYTITNGTIQGNNLFHSFAQFSPNNSNVLFANPANITDILIRVTGSSISEINGLIQANNPANIYLINPQGINFGVNASLNNINSFVATTADSILLENNGIFGARNPQNSLLTIGIPIGLQLGTNPAPINVSGNGNQFTRAFSLAPINRGNTNNGLKVSTGQTLALIGGQINLNGGILQGSGGLIELGAIGNNNNPSIVHINNQGFNYDNVQNFADINLDNKAAIDGSGFNSSAINIHSNNLNLNRDSAILAQHFGSTNSRGININNINSININNNNLDRGIGSGISTQILGLGRGGNINLNTENLLISKGAFIRSDGFNSSAGGDINMNISSTLKLTGSSFNGLASSSILASSLGAGKTGNINLYTGNIFAENGGFISSLTAGAGQGGNVNINNRDTINIVGASETLAVSNFSASTFGEGNAGNLFLTTPRLNIENSGRISSSSFGEGNAGNITINASEFVTVKGNFSDATIPSLIQSAATISSPVFRQIFGLPPIPTGDSGTITINTSQLIVSDEALINVRNDGVGNAGEININTRNILMNNQGGIVATTTSGEGGNITLQIAEVLQMRGGSFINTEAQGTGNGGNIIINTTFLVALENSDIIANAFTGNGGSIIINAKGIFGTQFRSFLTPESDITASSRFGLSGTVTINNPTVDPTSGLLELPTEIQDPSNQIITGCAAASGNSFTVTGRGGLPENPTQLLRGETLWQDLQIYTNSSDNQDISTALNSSKLRENFQAQNQILQATHWVINNNGQVELIAMTDNSNFDFSSTNCYQ